MSPLTEREKHVATAWLAVHGSAPSDAQLRDWAARLADDESVAGAADLMLEAAARERTVDADAAVSVARIYLHFFGKLPGDDPEGQAFWVDRLRSGFQTFGGITATILLAASQGPAGPHLDTLNQRLRVLATIVAAQRDTGRELDPHSGRSLLHGVRFDAASLARAEAYLRSAMLDGPPGAPCAWADPPSLDGLIAHSDPPDASGVRRVRHLAWHNSAGILMHVLCYLPSTFPKHEGDGVLALHGGGWRLGQPEALDDYASALAAAGRLVVVPSYRLTSDGVQSPQPEEDVEDFRALLHAPVSDFLGTPRWTLFGESSGGHLALLVAARQGARAFALYPPVDLQGDPPVSGMLRPYVEAYAPREEQRRNASITSHIPGAAGSRFAVWHGSGDPLVPVTQALALRDAAGAACELRVLEGEGHGFSAAARGEVVRAVAAFASRSEAAAA